jgi:hypothetical protein
MKISGRSSTITNAFIGSIVPFVAPSDTEIVKALEVLQIDAKDVRCSYCGDPATEWDHLRPIVVDQRPSGYITEICNLVPSCGKCNQSKSGRPWRVWIKSKAPCSPASRGVTDLQRRIESLEAYEKWRKPKKLDFEVLVGAELWKTYWENWSKLLEQMLECQQLADQVRHAIAEKYELKDSKEALMPSEEKS